MGENNLESKSESNFKSSGKIILDYDDFSKAKKGNFLTLSMHGDYSSNKLSEVFPNCTTTFFVKTEIEGENQRVSLKHYNRTSSKLYSGNKPQVVDYILPRTGKLELKKFIEGEIKINSPKYPNLQDNNFRKRNL